MTSITFSDAQGINIVTPQGVRRFADVTAMMEVLFAAQCEGHDVPELDAEDLAIMRSLNPDASWELGRDLEDGLMRTLMKGA